MRADNESHAAQRRLVSHAFSDKALKAQEQMLKGYAASMIKGLKSQASKGATNVVEWFNFTTFDVSSLFPGLIYDSFVNKLLTITDYG